MQNTQIIKIKPSDSWSTFDFREIRYHRELFYLLVWRDLKLRYKQTLLGIIRAVLHPALTAFIYLRGRGVFQGGNPTVMEGAFWVSYLHYLLQEV